MVLESRHTRLAAAHGAVRNMEAELTKHALLPGLVANDLLELYDRALVHTPLNEYLCVLLIVQSFHEESHSWDQAAARPRQRPGRAEGTRTQLTSCTQNDLSPRWSAWEQLDLLAQLGAQELGFCAEVWNAVPSYFTPSMWSTRSACSKEEEDLRVELFLAFARIRESIIRAGTAQKEIDANIAQLRREMSLMCTECMQAEAPQVLQPVLDSLEKELTMTRRLLKRELAPRSNYLRRLQLGIDAQLMTESRQVHQAVTLVLSADCKSVWLLPRATNELPTDHEAQDRLLPLKIDVHTVTGLVYGPRDHHRECNSLGGDLWRELSLNLSSSVPAVGQAASSSNIGAVALITDADTDALPALLGFLVLKGVDIRGGARGQLLWSSARMRLHSRAHKQTQSTERESKKERVTSVGGAEI